MEDNTRTPDATEKTAEEQEVTEQAAAETEATEQAATGQTAAETEATEKPRNSRKIIAIVAVAAALLVAFAIGTEFAENRAERRSQQMQGQIIAQQAQTANTSLISQDDATAIALNAAGVNSSDAQWITAYLDADHGFYQYEVSFVSGTYEYDFEIDATNGTIMESDIDSVFD